MTVRPSQITSPHVSSPPLFSSRNHLALSFPLSGCVSWSDWEEDGKAHFSMGPQGALGWQEMLRLLLSSSRILCPRLPSSMESSMSAAVLCAQVLVESHSGTGPQGCILLLGFANRTLHSSLVFAPRSSHLGLCYLSLQFSGWTSACVLS